MSHVILKSIMLLGLFIGTGLMLSTNDVQAQQLGGPTTRQPNFNPSVPRSNFRAQAPVASPPQSTPLSQTTYQPRSTSSSSSSGYRSSRGLVRLAIFGVVILFSIGAWVVRKISGE